MSHMLYDRLTFLQRLLYLLHVFSCFDWYFFFFLYIGTYTQLLLSTPNLFGTLEVF